MSQWCQSSLVCRHPPCGARKLELRPWRNGQSPPSSPPSICRSRVCVCFLSILRHRSIQVIRNEARAMKVTIREWNAVAAWRWDMPDDDVCGICRNPYDSTCSKCKFPGDECPLCMSFIPFILPITNLEECSANATTLSTWYAALSRLRCILQLTQPQHCIFSWLKQESSQEKCPMCRQRKFFTLESSSTLADLRCSFQVEEPRDTCRHRESGSNPATRYQPNIAPPSIARAASGALEQSCPSYIHEREAVLVVP